MGLQFGLGVVDKLREVLIAEGVLGQSGVKRVLGRAVHRAEIVEESMNILHRVGAQARVEHVSGAETPTGEADE